MTAGHRRLTIGMPIFNGESYVRHALAAIAQQTFEDWELIISDNASTDNTAAIIEQYALSDARVLVLKQDQNIGAAGNFNRVLASAATPYFKWATHDDVCSPELLASCVRELDADSSVVLAYAHTVLIDAEGAALGPYADRLHLDDPLPERRYARYHARFSNMGLVNPMYGVVRTSALKEIGGLGAYANSDIVLLGALSLRGKVIEVGDATFFRRVHPAMTIQRFERDGDRVQYLDPSAKPNPRVYRRMALEHLRVVMRSPLTPRQRLLALFSFTRFVWRRLMEKTELQLRRIRGGL